MRFGMIQTHWCGLSEHEWAFSCTATGNITEDVVQKVQEFIQRINCRFGVEALRLDASKKCNILMTQEAREGSQLKMFVPDETLLTRKMMDTLFNKYNEILSVLIHVKEVHFIHRLYMQLSDGKGGYEYYGVSGTKEQCKVDFIRMDPLFEGDFLADCVLASIDFPFFLSETAQQDVQQMADSLNAKIGFEAFECTLASFWKEDWLHAHEEKLRKLTEQLNSASLSNKERAALETEKQQEEQEEFDPADLMLFVAVDCNRIYSFAQLKLVCKTMQRIYDRIRQELDEEQITFESQRILLDDGHTWVKISLEGGEIIWRDEYCPYEGLVARAVEQVCFADYESSVELDQAILNVPAYIWKQNPHVHMLGVCRIRALKFMDLMRDYFDQTIDFSIASLQKAVLFLNAVRDSLTPDRVNLRKDASPRMARMFKALFKLENDNGALKIRDFENVLWQNIMQPLSAWLGEIFRIHCANLEWRAKKETRNDGTVIAEPVLYRTDNDFTMFPIAFAEKFFYRPGYELNIDDYYYSGVKQFKLAPAVTHEYRFKSLPEEDLPNNILHFQPK